MNTQDNKNILIVEDDTFLLKVYLERLREEGYSVSVATNGEEALSMAKQTRPGLILLDMILPRMSGFDFLKVIKQDEDMKSIPVIILSNLGQDADITFAKKLGAADYLVKADHSFRSVIDTIRKFIGEPSSSSNRNVSEEAAEQKCSKCHRQLIVSVEAKYCPWCGASLS